MHSNAKIKALKIYNWETILTVNKPEGETVQTVMISNCDKRTLWNKTPASNTAQSNTKDAQQKLHQIPKLWTVENIIQNQILHSFINTIPCSWNIIICPTGNVPANIYLLYIRLSVPQRFDVKCHISSCRLKFLSALKGNCCISYCI